MFISSNKTVFMVLVNIISALNFCNLLPRLGVLRLIGYRSLSADNRLGMFDRRSLKRTISKKRSQADDARAVRGLARHAAALSQSLSAVGEIIIMLKVRHN